MFAKSNQSEVSNECLCSGHVCLWLISVFLQAVWSGRPSTALTHSALCPVPDSLWCAEWLATNKGLFDQHLFTDKAGQRKCHKNPAKDWDTSHTVCPPNPNIMHFSPPCQKNAEYYLNN